MEDDSGIRTSKTVNGVTTEYFLDGSRIIAEKTNGNTTWYYYDGDSEYKGNVYYYFYNAQGDVMGLFDNNLNIVVEYAYDSWGNVVSITGSMADSLGQDNPFRYRGYYYDAETGLYYLNSRYYDAGAGRFINGDSLLGANKDILSNNIFAYCSNNPINCFDDTGNGKRWDWIKSNLIDPIKNIAVSAAKSFEIELGAGFGLKGSVSNGAFEGTIGLKADPINLELTKNGINGRIKADREATIGLSTMKIGNKTENIHNYNCKCEFNTYHCPYFEEDIKYEPARFDPCISIIGGELYAFIGVTFEVRFNIDTFFYELGVIELYEE